MNDANDTMTWDAYMRAWAVHAETEAFKRKLRTAVDIAQQGYDYGRLFCAMSGGKDSVALAGVLCAAGLREKIPLVYMHTVLNAPGQEECAYRTAEKLDMELDVQEPSVDIWEMLEDAPKDKTIWEAQNIWEACDPPHMLGSYQYQHMYDGSFSGMRAEESKGRLMNRKMRGPLYQVREDGSWMCLPIVDWTAKDVFAWIVKCGLPIHPHYRLLLERFRISPESPGSRVACIIPDEKIVARGALAHARVLYPDLWRRIVSIRPELDRET